MFATPAFAQAAGAAPSGTQFFMSNVIPLILIFAIFYFLLFRPQQRRAAAHRAMIDAVKKGDSVVTGGGLMGKVTKVDGDTVEVEIASNVRVKAIKGTLTEITPLGGGKAAND